LHIQVTFSDHVTPAIYRAILSRDKIAVRNCLRMLRLQTNRLNKRGVWWLWLWYSCKKFSFNKLYGKSV